MRLSEKHGYILVICSAVMFGLLPLMVKKMYGFGLSTYSVTALKNWIALVPLFFLSLREGCKMPAIRQIPGIAAAGVLSNIATSMLLLSSYVFISSGMATTIHFVYPAVVLAGCALIYRQRLDPIHLLCVALSIAGIALFYFPNSGGGTELKGIFLAFCSGVTYAGYIILVGGKNLRGMSAVSIAFFMTLISSIIFALWSAFAHNLTLPTEPKVWGFLIMFSILNGVLTLLMFQKGIQLIGPQKASILSTLEPMTSIVVGGLVFQEELTLCAYLGCAAILASVVIITCSGGEKARVKDA